MHAAITLLALTAFAQSTNGKLAPELMLAGKPADGACSFVARSKTATFESANGTPIDLPSGDYALAITCKHDGDEVSAPANDIKVAVAKTTSPKIDVRPARVRVEARRNNIMLPAKVSLYAPGTKNELAAFAANAKHTVAQGKYDIEVRLDDPRSPPARVMLNAKSIGGNNLTVIEADLSDGGLIVASTMNGKPCSAAVRVFAPGSERDLASVESGEEMRLPAGFYNVTTEARDNADFTTKRREVWINAGKTMRFSETFESGAISVSVTREGQAVDATVRLSLPNAADFFNHFASPGVVSLSPGTYDVSIESKILGPVKTLEKRGVKVTKGATQKVVFDLTQATVIVKVSKGGETIDAETHVRAAGGGEDAGPPDAKGVFRLWPGRYEVVVTLPDGDEILDGPFEVVLGQKITRAINVVRVTLVVNVLRGKSVAADAEVLVFRPGAKTPTAKGRAGAKLEMPPGIYDVKVVAGKDNAWSEGVKVKSAQAIRVDLPPLAGGSEETMPEGDLAPPAEDLPEGDAPTDSKDAGTQSNN